MNYALPNRQLLVSIPFGDIINSNIDKFSLTSLIMILNTTQYGTLDSLSFIKIREKIIARIEEGNLENLSQLVIYLSAILYYPL